MSYSFYLYANVENVLRYRFVVHEPGQLDVSGVSFGFQSESVQFVRLFGPTGNQLEHRRIFVRVRTARKTEKRRITNTFLNEKLIARKKKNVKRILYTYTVAINFLAQRNGLILNYVFKGRW